MKTISPGKQIPNSNDIRILPSNYIERAAPEYAPLVANEKRNLLKAIPKGQNFFYFVIQRSSNLTERGIGELFVRDRKTFLRRERAFKFGEGKVERSAPKGKFTRFDGSPLIVTSYIPDNILYLMSSPNSILCTNSNNVPTPVELEKNTVLGRLNKGVGAIGKEELRHLIGDDFILQALKNVSAPLISRSSKLELTGGASTVIVDNIVIKPTEGRTTKRAGAIRFRDGHFEGYDGHLWRKLKYV